MSQARYERLSTNRNDIDADDDDAATEAINLQRSDEFEYGHGNGTGTGNGNGNKNENPNQRQKLKQNDSRNENASEDIQLETGHYKRESAARNRHSSESTSQFPALSRHTGAFHNESGLESHLPMGHHHVPGSRVMQLAIGTLATILLYLTLSICLTFYQKGLIQKLKFPISIVCYHLVIKFILSMLVRGLYKCRMGKSRVQLDWRTAVRKMAPTGIASGIDIGFSNWGLELVPISLYTMTKSSTIVFILFFAILLGLEKKSWSLVAIVGLIAIGLFMFTYKSTQFDMLGFLFILVASLSSGIRWSFAQFVMQKSKLGLHNPVDMIYHMQPWMIVSLVPFLIGFEGQQLCDVIYSLPNVPIERVWLILFKISIGAFLAFLMEVSEFLVLSQTSSLTLSIAGIFKDICQLALAVELNGDQLSLMNVFGLIVCLAGICSHLIHKYSQITQQDQFNTFDVDMQYNETSLMGNGMLSDGHTVHHSSSDAIGIHSAQTVPLLDDSDSDDSNHGANNQNASDVIFDVLKRRDMQR